jgi:hypothetical protein
MPPNDRAGAQRQRSAVPDFIYKEKDKAKNKPKAFPLCSRERFFVLGKYSRIKIEYRKAKIA